MLAAGGSANVISVGLNNSQGTIQSTNKLVLDAGIGDLNNTQGLIASSADVDIKAGNIINANTKVETLPNQLDIKGIQGKNVVLSAGAINNTDGGILASETLAIVGTGVLNNTKGMLAASETATIVATGVNNTQGTIQSAEKLSLNVGTGTINNSQGLIASSTEVAIQADTVSNRNTKTGTTIKGIQAKNVSMLANQVDNTEGGILAIDSLLIQGAGTVNNTNGILSSTGDLTVKDTSASPTANTASKTQQVINTGGAIVANKKLTIDSKGLSGDGAILNAGVTTNGVTTEGDISIKLLDSFNQSAQGSVQANGNLDLQTLGNLNNAGLIQSRQVLTAQAANINNQLGGEFSAGATQLAANGSITNRGLIDGSFTLLQANDISNTGTGRIYGDQVSILAGSLTNSAEGGKAAVIAARSRMDIGAYVISNADDALLLSLGDMAVGNTLDANGKATGQAEAFINSSATVEVMGSLSIAAKSLNNIDGYATSGSSSTSEDVVKYTIVSPGNPNDKQVFYGKDGTFKDWNNDPSNPEYAMFYSTQFSDLTNYLTAIGSSLEWIIERYTHTTETTGSYGTRPATISVGGSMTTNFVDGVNDKSKIIVGGALTGNGLNFQNTGSSGSFTDSEIVGTAQTTSVDQSCNLFGCSDTRIYSPEALRPGSVISNSWQNPAEILYNTVPTINGTVGARSDVVVVAAQPGVAAPTTVTGQAPVSATGAAGTGAVVANNAVAGGAAVGNVNTASSGATTGTVSSNNSVTKANAPSSAGKVVRSLNNTTVTLPNNSLYIIQPTSGNRSPKGYLVETDPRFTQNKLWLGSDYMLKQMGYDPATQTQRLGDGFYEQKLIREQIAQLTGRRFLDDNNGEQYANDEAQYQALMTAGIQFAKDYKLIPGVALTAEQMALLTTDIVWLVSKTVTLADGSTTQVLVPQVYALVKPGDIDGSGNLLSAKSIDLKLKGDMVNSGLMAARGNLSIDAANIANLTGTIKGMDVSLLASQDIQSIQGNIIAGNALKIGAGNNVVIKAGNVAAGGNASITAGNDLLLIAQDTGRQVSINWGPLKKDKDGKDIPGEYENKDNSLSYGTYNQTGVNINVGGGLSMSAGNDFYAQGTQVNAGGGVSISAGRDASVTTALQGSSFEYNRTTTTRNGIFGKETRTITTRDIDLKNTASTLNAGGGADITAGRDLTLQGTNINAAGINLSAGNNVNVIAAYDVKEITSINSLKSNFKGGSTTDIELDRKAMVSNLNGNNGAVNITAGNTITLEGTLITGASFTPIAAKTNLLAALDTKTTEHSKTSNNLVWQTSQSKGTTNQVMHLTNINVPVGMSNFQGAGGITVQLPKNASLTEQITSLAKQPGNEYLTDLASQKRH